MDFVNALLVALHLLGMAAIVGGWFAVRTGRELFPSSIVWGARAQVLTGIILVGLAEMDGSALNYAKIAVKLVIALVVAAMAEIGYANSRKRKAYSQQLDIAGVGALANTLVAALW